MKKRHEEWYKLRGETKPKPASSELPPIRVLDLPGFQGIEDKLCIFTPTRGALSPEIDAMIDDLSTATFGITAKDTLFELPAIYNRLPEWSDERIEIEDRYYDHESQYETAEATDDEAVAILLLRGFDFRDARGQPLRCTLHFSRQAEAAAKGIMGKMPDRAAAGLESWTKKLEQEAKLHLQRKRTG